MGNIPYYPELFNRQFDFVSFDPNSTNTNVVTNRYSPGNNSTAQITRAQTTNNLYDAVNSNIPRYVFISGNYTIPRGRTLRIRNTTLISLPIDTFTVNFEQGSNLIMESCTIVNANIIGNPNSVTAQSFSMISSYMSFNVPVQITSGNYIIENSTISGVNIFLLTPTANSNTTIRVIGSIIRCVALVNINNVRRVRASLGINVSSSRISGQLVTGNRNGVEVGIVM